MGYPQEFIDKVIESTNLVDIISQYTQLKAAGRNHMGRCPFPDHAEKTPSFSVSEARQVYHCFGCKKSGNVVTFLRDYNGMNFPEALEYLAERNGIPIPAQSKDFSSDHNQQIQERKKKLLKANKTAADFFREMLKRASPDSAIKNYIQKRKLNAETLETFQIGYATAEWDLLCQTLTRQNISLDIAEDARLVKKRNDGSGNFDLFRERLMFPIHSASGEVLAFGGRILEQGEPKYLNSPESDVFIKGKVLYGLAQTAKYIRAEDCVLVVEGYMDLVSLYQAGLKHVVATMGTALTPEHAKIIKRLTSNVVVLFDGDEAGKMAAERSLPILLSQGVYPRGLILTEAKDPDEFVIKFGTEALQQKINLSPDLFKQVLQSWMQDYRGEASDKVKLIDKIKPVFEVMQDQRLKSLYAEDLCQLLKVSKDWLRQSLSRTATSKFSSSNSQNSASTPLGSAPSNTLTQVAGTGITPAADGKSATDQGSAPIYNISKASKVEILLLQSTLKSRASFDLLIHHFEAHKIEENFKQLLSQIKHLDIRQIFENAFQAYRQDPLKFDKLISLLIEQVDRPALLFQTSALDVAMLTEFDEDKEKKFIADLLVRLKEEYLRAQSKNVGTLIISGQADQSSSDEQLRQFAELQKLRLQGKKDSKS